MKLDGGGLSGIAAFFIWNATYLTKQYVIVGVGVRNVSERVDDVTTDLLA